MATIPPEQREKPWRRLDLIQPIAHRPPIDPRRGWLGAKDPLAWACPGEHMRNTAISLGARVIPVDIDHTDAGYTASCVQRISGEKRRFTGKADTYDDALQALKLNILSALRP